MGLAEFPDSCQNDNDTTSKVDSNSNQRNQTMVGQGSPEAFQPTVDAELKTVEKPTQRVGGFVGPILSLVNMGVMTIKECLTRGLNISSTQIYLLSFDRQLVELHKEDLACHGFTKLAKTDSSEIIDVDQPTVMEEGGPNRTLSAVTIKRLECKVCGKVFKSYMDADACTHPGEKTLTDKFCHKQFAGKSNQLNQTMVGQGSPEAFQSTVDAELKTVEKSTQRVGGFVGPILSLVNMRVMTIKECLTRGLNISSPQIYLLSFDRQLVELHKGDLACHGFTKLAKTDSSEIIDVDQPTVMEEGGPNRTLLESQECTRTGEKPFACNVCNQTFTQKNSAVIHMRIHKDEKPYTCNVCNTKFRKPSVLKMHVISHKQEQSYECDECGKRFIQKIGLKLHKIIHRRSLASSVHRQ